MTATPGELLVTDRDLLDAVLSFLDGSDALRIAATCRSFRAALAPSEAIWETYYRSAFGQHKFEFAVPTSWSRRFRVAAQRVKLRSVRWHHDRQLRECIHGTPPGARQGANSCTITGFAGGDCFAVYGGWTDARGISRDLNLLRRRIADGDGVGEWEWTQVPVSRRENAPARPTYGPSITVVPAPDGGSSAVRLVVHGGVCAGGYRGAQASLHSILLTAEEDAPDMSCEVLPDVEAEWMAEHALDGTPRAYHTATYVPQGEAHASNAHRVWVFGGFNDHADNGCISELTAFDLASEVWEVVRPDGAEPEERLGHSCVEIGGALYLSGGCTDSSNMKPGEGGEELSDIWRLDLTTPHADLAWHRVSHPSSAPQGALQRCHGAARLGSQILFFGGGRSSSLTNRVCAFDTASETWITAPGRLSGTAPSRRQNAACGFFPGTALLIVFGGWRLGPMGNDVNMCDTHILDLDHPTDGTSDAAEVSLPMRARLSRAVAVLFRGLRHRVLDVS